jgi:2,3-dihydroxybenzoate-AMP ligase
MLAGCTPWPQDYAQRYRARGLWQGATLWEMVEATVRRLPRKTALVDGDTHLTYADLAANVDTLAHGFVHAGIAPLDRVVLQLPNTPDFVVAYLALVRIGAIPVMALRAHRHAEVAHFLRASGAAAYVIPDVIRDFDYRAMAVELARDAPALRSVFVAGEPGPGQIALSSLRGSSQEGAGALDRLRPDPSEVVTMLLSGGTTSMSKLIPRTHDDYVLNARLCSEVAGFAEDSVLLLVLPLGHNYNLASPGLLGALHRGATVVLAPSPDAAEVFGLVERERVTHISAAVPLVSNWLNSDADLRFDTSSLRVVQNGGARLAPELRARLRERFQCTPQEVYGTAEGLINMTRLDDRDELLLHSSGAPVCADDEIRVAGDDDREVPDGMQGELLTRGPYTIRGYYNAAEKNREAFTADGFYRMGDLVRRQGRHVFTEGRRKDLINRGGEKISCDEVENLMYMHPYVKAATLVAMPDPVFGEKACAFVVPRPGVSITFDDLTAFLRQQKIAPFKLPERLEVVTELPLSPVGKILKRELRDMITAKLAREAKERSA